jgi:tRNA modification GTPase
LAGAPTIYALSSGSARAGVAVVRISGPRAFAAVSALIPDGLPRPRRAALRRLRDPANGVAIDSGLVLLFPAPGSFTGEDVAELQVHGSPAVLAALFGALDGQGLAPAEPGAFTRRAFVHGKLDLAQAEGLADLIAADSEAQRRQALRQLDGAWGQAVAAWTQDLTGALAYLEAGIDFPDEADVPASIAVRALPVLARIAGEMAASLAAGRSGEIVRDGFHVAILGAPNAGKSTLLNALAGREAAIVSDIPGTTRDIVEVRLVLGGQLVVLADTAGLRATQDRIEQEGVRRALRRAETADLRLFLSEVSESIPDSERDLKTRFGLEIESGDRGDDLVVRTKSDLMINRGLTAAADGNTLFISAATGDGLKALEDAIAARAAKAASGAGLATRTRHVAALRDAHAALLRALDQGDAPELAAEDVRSALAALGRIVGRVDVEAVLDLVFSAFCIGK